MMFCRARKAPARVIRKRERGARDKERLEVQCREYSNKRRFEGLALAGDALASFYREKLSRIDEVD